SATARVAVDVTLSAIDPDGDEVAYLLDWDDGSSEDWTINYAPGQSIPMTHIYQIRGGYQIRAKAKDTEGNESEWSLPVSLALPTSAPDTPTVFSCPDTARIGLDCAMVLRLGDPDGDSVAARVDWGDGVLSSWSALIRSGDTVRFNHVYRDSGRVKVKVQARDSRGVRCGWSEVKRLSVRQPWVTVMQESFEGAFPGAGWTRLGGEDEPATWDAERYRPYAGRCSCWCAGSSRSAPGPYKPDMEAWMVYGPFTLQDANEAQFTFRRWAYTEDGYDEMFWGVSVDGTDFYGYSLTGAWPYWECDTIDLKSVPGLGNVCGHPRVWIAFAFLSDEDIEYEGCYVDNVLIRKIPGTAGGTANTGVRKDRPGIKATVRSLR
ncbi:MAG: hypothetical protein R6X13_09065, partial [bacterium]